LANGHQSNGFDWGKDNGKKDDDKNKKAQDKKNDKNGKLPEMPKIDQQSLFSGTAGMPTTF